MHPRQRASFANCSIHEGYFGSSALVVQHSHILQADEGLEDFTSIGQDEGVHCLFSHNYN